MTPRRAQTRRLTSTRSARRLRSWRSSQARVTDFHQEFQTVDSKAVWTDQGKWAGAPFTGRLSQATLRYVTQAQEKGSPVWCGTRHTMQ
eukprot:10143241-Lingulodinium_polyedra.AAC.1